MKRLLQLSLALNVVLLGATWWRSDREGTVESSGARRIHHDASVFKRPARTVTKPTAPPTPWAALDSADPARLVENLRAIGCPEQTIRELVALRICRGYRQQLLAAEAWAEQAWDYTRNLDAAEWRERRFARDRLRNEMLSEVESVLGVSLSSLSSSMFGWPSDSMEESLSADKRRRIREIQLKYRELSDDLSMAAHAGWLDAEDRAQLEEWSRQEQAELATVLTPAELEERFYRDSAAARYVQQNLPAASSEAEFRAMVKLADEFGLAHQPSPMALRYGIVREEDPAWQEYQQRKAAFDERLEQVLGEDRIAEQAAADQARLEAEEKQRQEESEQQALADLTEMADVVGISAEDARAFFERMKELRPELEAQFAELEQSLTGTPEEQKSQRDKVARELLEGIATDVLGEKGRELVDKIAERE
jgi:hypothetical protein